MKETKQFRVLIADDHELIRRGVRALFNMDSGFVVCGEAANGKEAIEQVQRLHPDVVVLDVSMPVLCGLDAAAEIRRIAPQTRIVILTMHDSSQIKDQALRAGADAFVVKSSVAAELMETVRSLLKIEKASPARARQTILEA